VIHFLKKKPVEIVIDDVNLINLVDITDISEEPVTSMKNAVLWNVYAMWLV
jgi:hypothetical protein